MAFTDAIVSYTNLVQPFGTQANLTFALRGHFPRGFDIATMDKDSGYIRTTSNEGVVVLGGDWGYKVQISIKLVPLDSGAGAGTSLDKIRVQATCEISEIKRGVIKAFLRGYDQVLLQNLFQDLQAK